MLKFNDLLQFPSFYRGRYGSEKTVILSNIKVTEVKNDDGSKSFLFKCISNKKYETIIEIIKRPGDRGIKQCAVRAYCGCDSFKYEFASLFSKEDSLYKSIVYTNNGKPRDNNRKRNKYNIVSPCKHILRFANFLVTKI